MIVSVDKFPVLITSAAYINTELAAEYGELPPSFLPFGHGRLFQAQVKMLESCAAKVALTIPNSFEPDESDLEWLSANQVSLIRVPDGLSLGESLSYACIVGGFNGALGILHGDTLVPSFDLRKADVVGVAKRPSSYTWGRLNNRISTDGNAAFLPAGDDDVVLCGWFAFSDAAELLRCITLQRGNFLEAIELYGEKKPLSSERIDGWLDFGHLQTFHQARSTARTERSFNSIAVANRTVFKSGEKLAKLRDEAEWFSNLPPVMRMFAPKFLGWEGEGYRIGYEYSPTIHELYIFGSLPQQSWERIMSGCFEFLQVCSNHASPEAEAAGENFSGKTLDKTLTRLALWSEQSGISLEKDWTINGRAAPSLLRVAEDSIQRLSGSKALPGVMHGDFCFSNIFFDFREQIVKVIDPRGSMQDGYPSIYGDLRYDLAKLNHSISGYDHILTGKYQCDRSGNDLQLAFQKNATTSFIRGVASAFSLGGQRVTDAGISALTIHLFLSMLPLHADRGDRQLAFLANALKLFTELEG